jgi:hypothetical protein
VADGALLVSGRCNAQALSTSLALPRSGRVCEEPIIQHIKDHIVNQYEYHEADNIQASITMDLHSNAMEILIVVEAQT